MARALFAALVLVVLVPTLTLHAGVVRIETRGKGYVLLRDGQPYWVRGAGVIDTRHLEQLRAAGANSVRTWGGKSDGEVMDRAHELGLTTALGIWLGQIMHGFRYDDPKQVQEQFEKARMRVRQYRNHPGLLVWGVGNEVEIFHGDDNPRVWKAVGEIVRMIKEEDPNHPTMAVLAGVSPKQVDNIRRHCPELDILGVNGYGANVPAIPGRVEASGWHKPFVVSEFGPGGDWNAPKTAWGAPIEPTSTEKAKAWLQGYRDAVERHKERCLGSYVFYWGSKYPWFPMFLPSGERLGAVDAMTLAWSGKRPPNTAPEIMYWETEAALHTVAAGSRQKALVVARDGDRDPLRVQWEVRRGMAGTMPPPAGEEYQPQEPIASCFEGMRTSYVNSVTRDVRDGEITGFSSTVASVEWRAPQHDGAYSLCVYVYDDRGNAATARVPFQVKRE